MRRTWAGPDHCAYAAVVLSEQEKKRDVAASAPQLTFTVIDDIQSQQSYFFYFRMKSHLLPFETAAPTRFPRSFLNFIKQCQDSVKVKPYMRPTQMTLIGCTSDHRLLEEEIRLYVISLLHYRKQLSKSTK